MFDIVKEITKAAVTFPFSIAEGVVEGVEKNLDTLEGKPHKKEKS